MTIDKNLSSKEYSAPIIRQINQATCKTPWKESISLWLGQLWNGFDIALEIIEVLQWTVKDLNKWKNTSVMYSPNAGLASLRTEVAKNQSLKDGKEYDMENVAITIWVQNAMQATIWVLKQNGAKRVLIPEINFWIYKKIPASYDMEVVTYKLTDDFGIDLKDLENKVEKDDLIIFNSPANPTWKVLSEQEVKQLWELLENKLTRWYAISDEIYDELVYEPWKKATSISKYFDRTIVLNWVSKSWAMAGDRVGWVVSQNKDFIKAFVSFNTNQISSPPTLSQLMALPVVKWETAETITKYRKILLNNREYVMNVFDRLGIKYTKPEWSFYIFPKIIDKIPNPKTNRTIYKFSYDLSAQENGVVVIPWEAFWDSKQAQESIRISLAVPEEKFQEGIDRLVKALNVEDFEHPNEQEKTMI